MQESAYWFTNRMKKGILMLILMFTLSIGLTSATKKEGYYYTTVSAYSGGTPSPDGSPECGGLVTYLWHVDIWGQTTLVDYRVTWSNCP